MPTHLERQNKSVNIAHTHTHRKHSALQYNTVPDSGSRQKDRITPEQI